MERRRSVPKKLMSGLFVALLIGSSEVVLGQHEVWTYDFGSKTDTHSTGESTSFLPDPQTNGGVSRVRVGSGGGGVSLESSETGTFAALNLQAADNTSDVLFQISGFNGTGLFYSRFQMRLKGGNSGTIGFLFGNGANFTSNSGYVGDSFAGFRMALEPDGSILTQRRTSSSWSDAFGIGSLFIKDQIYKVEVYANNTSSNAGYFRDGEGHTLASGEWALWVDGVKFNDFGSVGIALGDAIDGFLFYGQSSIGNVAQLEIDDLVYSNSLPDIRRIESFADYSTEGEWRMLSLPYDTSIEQLARQTLVQGVAGSFPGAGTNLFTTHNGKGEATSQNSDWIAPVGLSDIIERGQGFIWLLYDNDRLPENKPLPLDLTIASGASNAVNLNTSLSTDNDGWNLLGNPFSEDLLVDDIAGWTIDGGSLASVVAQVYDPESESYVVLNQPNDKVAAFQGFFIQNSSAAGITIPSSAMASSAPFYKRPVHRESRTISFRVRSDENSEGRVLTDRAIELFFSEESESGWDLRDAVKLTPLSDKYIGLGFAGYQDGKYVLKSQDSRPYNLNNSITIPAEFYSEGLDGSAELTIHKTTNIPEGWRIEVEDTHTGLRQVIDRETSYHFDFEATRPFQKTNDGMKKSPVIQSVTAGSESSRFLIHIIPGQDLSADVPSTFSLKQNYPNPFNPSTIIGFELPENSEVNLSVYDMTGRRVATLLNESLPSGSHRVKFDAGGLPSGTYIYRLKSGSNIQIKKLTYIK